METLIQEGKTEDDVVAERPFADLDAKWADTEQAGKTFVRALYRSMADKPVPARKPLLRQVLRRN
jgi:cyclase